MKRINNSNIKYSSKCQECSEKLNELLFECCEQAYKVGINSVEIFKILHSPIEVIEANLISNSQILNNNFTNVENNNYIFIITLIRRRFQEIVCLLINYKVLLFFLIIPVIVVPLLLFSNICKWENLNLLPNITGKRCFVELHATILEMVRPIANCPQLCNNPHSSIEFNENSNSMLIQFERKPSKEEFLSAAYSSRPIIVRNSFPNIEFNLITLKEIFESEPGAIDSVVEECQFLPLSSSFTSLQEVFQTLSEETDFNLSSTPWYIGWSNCHQGVATKLRELFPRPDFLPSNSELSIIDWIFIGSPGYGAAMHIDYVRRPSWQLQISGTKRWILKPPPECETECSGVTFTSQAGDLVFLETNLWYHETFVEGTAISISIGSEYD